MEKKQLPTTLRMLFPLLCICTYLLLVFPTGIASLVAQPQATSPYRLVDANLTDVEGLAGANDLGRIRWVHLYTTFLKSLL